MSSSHSGSKTRSYVDRITRLIEEKAALSADIKEIYSEAKADGYDTKALRKVVALSQKGLEDLSEQAELVRLYADDCNLQLPLFG